MDGDTVVVTGGSRGIGRATALKLAEEGAEIIVNYRESEGKAKEVVETIRREGSEATAIQADVADEQAVENLMAEAREFGGSIDYLVNNAGAILQPSDWTSIDTETWRRTLDVNLKGVFNCTREVAPRMVERGTGKIVNVTSTWSFLGAAPVIAYTAAKAGVVSLTRSFATELAPEVTVNAVAFGTIDTAMTRTAGEEFVEQVIDETPLDRLGEPEEAAGAIYFLLSDLCGFMTGETLIVDGGHRF